MWLFFDCIEADFARIVHSTDFLGKPENRVFAAHPILKQALRRAWLWLSAAAAHLSPTAAAVLVVVGHHEALQTCAWSARRIWAAANARRRFPWRWQLF